MSRRDALGDALAAIAPILFPGDEEPRRILPTTRAADGDTPMHVFAWRRDLASVRLLLAAGANPDAIGDMGETPLHVAVRQGDTDIVGVLLSAGARGDIVSEFDETAEQMAQAAGGDIAALFKRARRSPAVR